MVVMFSFSIAQTTLQPRYDFIFIIIIIIIFLIAYVLLVNFCIYSLVIIFNGHFKSLLKMSVDIRNVKIIKMRKLTN